MFRQFLEKIILASPPELRCSEQFDKFYPEFIEGLTVSPVEEGDLGGEKTVLSWSKIT